MLSSMHIYLFILASRSGYSSGYSSDYSGNYIGIYDSSYDSSYDNCFTWKLSTCQLRRKDRE
jgi:hypothetical protein